MLVWRFIHWLALIRDVFFGCHRDFFLIFDRWLVRFRDVFFGSSHIQLPYETIPVPAYIYKGLGLELGLALGLGSGLVLGLGLGSGFEGVFKTFIMNFEV